YATPIHMVICLSLHDALPILIYFYDKNGKLISSSDYISDDIDIRNREWFIGALNKGLYVSDFYFSIFNNEVNKTISTSVKDMVLDRKSTRLNSSHVKISYAVC